MGNTIEELRAKAKEILALQKESVELNKWGSSIQDLIQELGIYHIELEHQNAALDLSEKEMAKSRAEYVELFENAPVGYVIIDGNRNIVRINQTFYDTYLPYVSRSQNLQGQSFDPFVCTEYRSTFGLFCAMIQKTGVPVTIELRIFDRFNKPHYVLLTAGERGEGDHHYRLAFSDLNLQKSMEKQLARAKDQAEESDRRKSAFLVNVSHELRTALTTIVGYSEMLGMEGQKPKEHQACVKYIRSAAQSLLTLTDEILNLSTLESGKIPLREENIDVPKICKELATMVQSKYAGKKVQFVTRVDKMPVLLADPNRLRQIVLAVLEHTAQNAEGGTVQIHANYVPNELGTTGILGLTFSGKNIFSGESSLNLDVRQDTVAQNGNRLGLYFAKQILRKMNGEMIWIHPLDSMRLEIPVKVSFIPTGFDAEPVSVPEPSSYEAKKCLLVDNAEDNLEVLAQMVKNFHCEPTCVTSGKEALEVLSKKPIDLILTDMWMPLMSGEEFAAQVRQNPDYDDIPIAAVTADSRCNETFDMSFFVQTIIKPVTQAKLKRLFDVLEKKSS